MGPVTDAIEEAEQLSMKHQEAMDAALGKADEVAYKMECRVALLEHACQSAFEALEPDDGVQARMATKELREVLFTTEAKIEPEEPERLKWCWSDDPCNNTQWTAIDRGCVWHLTRALEGGIEFWRLASRNPGAKDLGCWLDIINAKTAVQAEHDRLHRHLKAEAEVALAEHLKQKKAVQPGIKAEPPAA